MAVMEEAFMAEQVQEQVGGGSKSQAGRRTDRQTSPVRRTGRGETGAGFLPIS